MVLRSGIVPAAALTIALVAGGTSLFAQGPGFGGFRGRGPGAALGGPGVGLPLGQLELTDAQRQQIRQLVQQRRNEMRPLVEHLRTAAEARRQAVTAIPVDEARIRAATQELAQVQADVAVQQARLQSEIVALLTPEQQQRAQQLRAEREARLQQRRSRR